MKNNKGFTLAELISIIVILGILALIAVPILTKYVDSAREKSYDEQIQRIIRLAKDYMLESEEFLYGNSSSFEIKLEDLKKAGYIEDEDLLNPKTEEKMNGCVKVTYNETKKIYDYIYIETCN